MIEQDILQALRASQYWTPKTREKSETIQELKCPECGGSAWVYKDRPFSINCNRLNNCGARSKTLDLFPQLKNVEKNYPATPADPLAPARAFLDMRGLKSALDGLEYQYWPNVRKTGSGAVMFQMEGANGKPVYNGRLLNPPRGEGKTHNRGSTSGVFWQHPGLEYDRGQETWVTEGIIDALSLIELGQQAIAVLASGQDPENVDLDEFPTLILAFDNDNAGAKAFKKWGKAYPNATGMTPTRGDWSDMLRSGKKEITAEMRSEMYFNWQLAIAKDAETWAAIWAAYKKRPAGLFIFDGCYFFADDKYRVCLASDFTVSVEHYRLDTTTPESPEYRYTLAIKPKRGRKKIITMAAGDLSSQQSMTTNLMTRARVLWRGSKPATTALLARIVGSDAPVIRQMSLKGYDKDSGSYVFKNFRVDQAGKFETVPDQGFYKAGREYIRPDQSADLCPCPGTKPSEIFSMLFDCWGERALTAMAWTVASWFMRDIKATIPGKFFPLISLYGDPQTGKSNLTRFLNALQCVDEEGIPMTKSNTQKGIFRKLSQRSNLFQALLEEDKDAKSKFDYRAVLTIFNDSPLYIRAEKTNGNETSETVMASTIMFVQNNEPFKSRPEKERVVSMEFTRNQLDGATAEAFEKLSNVPLTQLAWFYVEIMRHHNDIRANWLNYFNQAKTDLKPAIRDSRIREVHALVLGFYRIMCERIGVDHTENDLREYIEDIAHRKLLACRDEDVSIADIFLETLIDATPDQVREFCDVSAKTGHLYIYMPWALRYIKDQNLSFGSDTLLTLLKSHRSYVSRKAHWFSGTSRKTWVFDVSQIDSSDLETE